MKNNLYTESQIEKDLDQLKGIHDRLSSIIWMPQENQKEHFDKLSKAEQIALLEIFSSIKNTINQIVCYKSWFKND